MWHPDQAPDNERSGQRSSGVRSQSSHRGTVLGMGEPARTAKGDAPIPHGFSVGDEVVFVFALQGTEESRRGTWSDGEPCVWIAQEEVIAVVERSRFTARDQDDCCNRSSRSYGCSRRRLASISPRTRAARTAVGRLGSDEGAGRDSSERMRAVVEHA